MQLALIKQPGGALLPFDDAEADKLRRIKAGSVMRGEFAEMRNGRFFAKWWTLVGLAFEIWAEGCQELEYEGMPVLPDKERFRKDLTIMAGFFRPVWDVKGRLRVEAESLNWSKMSEDRFNSLYQATITAIVEKIIPNRGYDEKRLREWVDRVLSGYA